MSLPPELRNRVFASVQAERSLTRTSWHRQSKLFFACAVGASLLIFVGMGGAKLGERSLFGMLVAALTFVALGIVASVFAFGKGRASLGMPVAWLRWVAVCVPALAIVALWCGSLLCPPQSSAPRHDVTCGGLVALLAFCPLVAAWIIRKKAYLASPNWTGVLLGECAGAMGALLMTLKCECDVTAHLWLGHLLPVVVLGVIGMGIAAASRALRQ